MKKIELLAERAKIIELVTKSEYYTIKVKPDFGETAERVNITEEELRENYGDNKKLLKKLDAINNILFEADAKEYVEVLGNRLSIATARKYLSEFLEDVWADRRRDGFGDFLNLADIEGSDNLRAVMYSNCTVRAVENIDKDPLNLKERRREFKKKQLDWYYALRTAVAVSDATTEVELIY